MSNYIEFEGNTCKQLPNGTKLAKGDILCRGSSAYVIDWPIRGNLSVAKHDYYFRPTAKVTILGQESDLPQHELPEHIAARVPRPQTVIVKSQSITVQLRRDLGIKILASMSKGHQSDAVREFLDILDGAL